MVGIRKNPELFRVIDKHGMWAPDRRAYYREYYAKNQKKRNEANKRRLAAQHADPAKKQAHRDRTAARKREVRELFGMSPSALSRRRAKIAAKHEGYYERLKAFYDAGLAYEQERRYVETRRARPAPKTPETAKARRRAAMDFLDAWAKERYGFSYNTLRSKRAKVAKAHGDKPGLTAAYAAANLLTKFELENMGEQTWAIAAE